MRTTIAVVVATLAVLTAGCGSSSSRPSVDSISTALQSKDLSSKIGGSGTLTKKVADCFAKVVHDSRVSDRGLRSFLHGESNFSTTDLTALQAVLPKIVACQGSGG